MTARFTCDVAIVGGGPAGCATALSLRSHAPSLSVVLIEKTQYESLRPGEVLPGLARGLLDRLGVWDAFVAQRYRPVYAAAACWGDDALRENHSIYSALGNGWHLDRSAFDALLAAEARERGVETLAGVGVAEIQEEGARGWWLRLSDGTVLDARFVVDATGRSALVARRLGARPLVSDGLVGFARHFCVKDGHLPDGREPRTVIEASPEGWWYGAALGEGRIAIVAMTDLDIARQVQLERESVWHRMMGRTQWIRSLVPEGAVADREMVRAAGSACLEPVCGNDWLAVGDAASAYDPLSSQGIVKALRSGIFASYAIAERLRDESDVGLVGLERYRQFVRQSFQGYQQAYSRFYARERRWPEEAFWKRRQMAAVTSLAG